MTSTIVAEAEEVDIVQAFRHPRRVACKGKMYLIDEDQATLVDSGFTLVDMDTLLQYGCFCSPSVGEDYLRELKQLKPDHALVNSTKVTWMNIKASEKPPKKDKSATPKKPRTLLFSITPGAENSLNAEYVPKAETLEQAVKHVRFDNPGKEDDPVVVFPDLKLLSATNPDLPQESQVCTLLGDALDLGDMFSSGLKIVATRPEETQTEFNIGLIARMKDFRFLVLCSETALPHLTSIFGDSLERALEEPKQLKSRKKAATEPAEGAKPPKKRRANRLTKEKMESSGLGIPILDLSLPPTVEAGFQEGSPCVPLSQQETQA